MPSNSPKNFFHNISSFFRIMLFHILLTLVTSASAAVAKMTFAPPLPFEVKADLAKRDSSEYQLFQLRDEETGIQKRGVPNDLRGVQTTCRTASCFDFTFDDGPYVNMRHITETALANDFKVTYFLTVYNYDCAYDHPYADEIRHAYKHGMQICSHTATHPYLTNLTHAQIDVEIELVETMLHKIIGVVPACIRPPYGAVNESIAQYLNDRHGLVVINWTDFSGDADGATVEESLDVYRNITAPRHSVVLNHEPYNTTANIVFPEAIKIAKHNGYKTGNFQTVSKSFGFNPYKSVTKPGKRDNSWNCTAAIAARCATNPAPDICG